MIIFINGIGGKKIDNQNQDCGMNAQMQSGLNAVRPLFRSESL